MNTTSRSLFASLLLVACGGGAPPAPPAPPAPAEAAAAPAPTPEAAPAPSPSPAPTPSPTASAPPPPPPPCPAGMTLVPGGTYRYGPIKKDVTIADLCVDQTEVTAKAYEACVAGAKCNDAHLDCAEAATYKKPGKENHPVVCVDFPQASAFCASVGKRLPLEEEWEWFARGGAEGRTYAYGNDAPADQVCWSGSKSGARTGTCEVGAFAPGKSVHGLDDVTGNVFEWTSTKADGKSPMVIVKGGTWRDGTTQLLTVRRPGGFKPEYRCGFGGIRCVSAPAK